jgi:histidyl-tRNA synthetase
MTDECENPLARGTRVVEGQEASIMRAVLQMLDASARSLGYEPIFLPTIAPQAMFTDKAGPEVLGQMYAFPDKKGRPLCLAPEATAIVQRLYDTQWARTHKKPVRVFYIQRCFRYERPQAGRYREFTQFGMECLGPAESLDDMPRLLAVLLAKFKASGVQIEYAHAVKRGLAYYTNGGFEALCPALGAQKQIAGGGPYAQGSGFAIGVDRLVLAIMKGGPYAH